MIKKLIAYLSDVRTEMGKVSWPTRAELMESSKLVLYLSFILAVLIFLADNILSRLINLVI
ncbi:MAG: preprotein translocase subunit SecE [bacterium]